MINVFISQPMAGRTDDEILKEREQAILKIKNVIKEDDVHIIDSFFEQNAPADANPLWYLGCSIIKLAYADVAYFCKGWNDTRGCRIEHKCAEEYNIEIIEEQV